MRLSDRIIALYNAVDKGESVADIGTDHGYVPLLLMRDGISPHVIMSDISDGSLSKAIANFALLNIDIDDSCFRVGDGIDTLEPGEVDDIIIAGLGGKTIVEILEADIEKTRSYKRLILQPRNNCGELRCFLYRRGYRIDREILCEEGKFVCEIICASQESEDRPVPFDERDIRWMYPESFEYVDNTMLEHRLEWKFQNILDEIDSLRKSTTDMSDRISTLESDYRYLEDLIARNRAYNT